MSGSKTVVIRTLASVIFFLRRGTIAQAQLRWMVLSGSVGKTVARRTLERTLQEVSDVPVHSLHSDYVNELGVICTALGIRNFSPYAVASWWSLLTSCPPQRAWMLVEMGADFRTDIRWFLRRITPYYVVLTPGTEVAWTPVIDRVLADRVALSACTIPEGEVLVSSADVVHRKRLTNAGVSHLSFLGTDDLYDYPHAIAAHIAEREYGHTPARVTPADDRFIVRAAAPGTVVIDIYKVTPLCLAYVLSALERSTQQTKVLVTTGIRPRYVPYEALYQPFISRMSKLTEVVCIGDWALANYLKKAGVRVRYVPETDVLILKKNLEHLLRLGAVVAIKASKFCDVEALRTLGKKEERALGS